MKSKYVSIITLSLAIVLVGTVAYASEKRKEAKLLDHELSEMSEEALQAELLNTSEMRPTKQADTKVASAIKADDANLAELTVEFD